MLTSKQRSQLKGLAATADTIIQVGKGGINDNLITQVRDALKARELVKGKVLENSLLTAREVCDTLAQECKAEQVQVIGSKFVLYKRNETNPKIELVKSKKK
ncbi:MAG: ribosome assembly RNA-binding protein YhbY [Oscillospiraceae bacterium]|nr:ribosome assembly RNA-binding protein YhbY [Oscillospiraceae bacterium]MBR5261581.1 ribosome assembly RNA-binding protein YhbY [Oscillospiraceae bacterium]